MIDTLSYMIAGYSVIFGVLLVYIVSLIVRFRQLRREEKMLLEIEAEDE